MARTWSTSRCGDCRKKRSRPHLNPLASLGDYLVSLWSLLGHLRLGNISFMAIRYWLKALGSSEEPLPDAWKTRNNGVLVDHATFPWKPGMVQKDDKIVYYATGWKLVFAVGTVTTAPYPDAKNANGYDWRVKVVLEIAKEFVHDGALLNALNVPSSRNDVRNRIKRRSHVQLSKAEFAAAVAALS